MRRILMVLTAALATTALANGGGGSYEWRGGTAATLVPKKQGKVRLVAEELRIRASASGTMDVTARYELDNAGAVTPLTYVVPVVSPRLPDEALFPTGPDDYGTSLTGRKVAESIRIELGGKAVACKYAPLPAPKLRDASDPGSGVVRTEQAEAEWLGGASAEVEIDGFCTAAISLPKGRSTLTLRYRGGLFGTRDEAPVAKECDALSSAIVCADGEGEEECVARHEQRAEWHRAHCTPKVTESPPELLLYPLAPAATWAGPVERVSVTLALEDLIVDAGLPAGAKRDAEGWRWTWREPDLAALGALSLRLRAAEVPAPPATAGGCGVRRELVSARASSQIPAQGKRTYGPDRAIDADPATAWCVNTAKLGVGEWIELELPVNPVASRALGVRLVPGYGGSQALYDANGRVAAVRLRPCGGTGEGVLASWTPAKKVGEAALDVPGSAAFIEGLLPDAQERGRLCLRLELATTVPGAKYQDVCLSDVDVAFACR